MLTAFTVGAKVMLLKNYVVELKLMNGSIGTVVDIVYKDEEGPRSEGALPAYIVVDFPQCLIEDGKGWKKQDACKNVPIPTIVELCKKHCCGIETVPL